MPDQLQLEGHKLLYHLDAVEKWMRGEFFYPLHLDIGATSMCNIRCVHCFYDYLGHKQYVLQRERLLGLMDEIGPLGVKSIYFASNGEPLMNPAVPDAIARAKNNGVDAALATNGILLTREISEKILPHLSWIRLSILASSEKLYCVLHRAKPQDYKRLMKNISDAVAVKRKNHLAVTIGIQMSLLPQNGAEIATLAAMAKAMGADYITIRPICLTERNQFRVGRNLTERFSRQIRRAQARADKHFYVSVRQGLEREIKEYTQCLGLPFLSYVAADGGVYACGCFLEEPGYFLGSIYKKSFKDIWRSRRRQEVMEKIARKQDFSKCDTLCRHHSINKFLFQLKNPPEHVNFI